MMGQRLSLLTCLLSLGASACQSPRTEIVLTIGSNLDVPAEMDQVRLVVTSETASTRFDQTYGLGAGQTKLPIVLGLVPDKDKKLGFRAVATGLKAGVVVVERSAVTSFVPDQTLALYLDLLQVCVQTSCTTGQTCGADGRCIPEAVTPADLPKYGTPRDAAFAGGQDGGLIGGLDAGFVVDGTVESPIPDASTGGRDSADDTVAPDASTPVGDAIGTGPETSLDAGVGPDAPVVPAPHYVIGQFASGGRASGPTYTLVGSFVWAGGNTKSQTWSISAP